MFLDVFLNVDWMLKRAREATIQKRPQTLLSSSTGTVQDPPHREVNAWIDGYPCQMGSVQSE